MSRKQTGGIVFFLSLVLLLLLSGCGTTKSEPSKEENTTQAKVISPDDYPIVTITMEDNSTITLELYPDKAPNTVNNFVSLVNKGFYDGLIFHRIIPDFMIQGGDPNGNGTGGPGYSIKGEFSENGFENDLKHERGVISMARSQLPDSAGSQFFIMVADAPHLDGEYAPFGKVIEGMDVVDKIVSSKRDKNDKPVEEIKMKQITVDTKGIDYEEPKKLKE
ncbi:peptidyl-prolyl cis-trans isomerase [Niallia circulans]|uniref:peptidylprolyl isomerase n=1 Tax=Niallia TaxID=2837506 RepID=UPI00077C400C|nr:peptidylprolyl isomerase [Niallia circulans]MDR4315091.1 peptidylprolyl isomerase [Niallia circulans]MED3839822.1 peptidylprolyl isomerase [Niallia circulans]MED4241308.1 peptidylprolyl isomerase [Niallia circulans]MED4247969.1 peptidylprolyl isomerase [Niallia circulans]QKH61554.1 peptidylprolyl isomerase [Niallia circulans]